MPLKAAGPRHAARRPSSPLVAALALARARAARRRGGGPIAILGEAGIEGIAAEPYAALAALLEAIEAGAEVPKTVLLDTRAWPGATDELPSAAHDNAARALAAAKAWLAAEALGSSRLLFLTEAAVALPGEGEGANLATAPLWGLLRSAQAEYPGRFALLDLDSEEASLEALPAALALADEPQLALRDGVAHVPRLSRASEGEEERGTPIDPESTVLISGGTGGLGALVARHLVTEHGARNLLLISRRGGAAPGATELLAELEELGAKTTIAACDVSDRAQLEGLLDSIPKEHPLGAVIHTAGVLEDGLLESLDAERLAMAMQPKVDAAWHLHELTADLELSQFLLFSSAAGVLGNPAQANYAAANAFLDVLAAYRQARGLPATSMAWGPWGRAAWPMSSVRLSKLACGASASPRCRPSRASSSSIGSGLLPSPCWCRSSRAPRCCVPPPRWECCR